MTENSLTDTDLMIYLLQQEKGGDTMKGAIRAKGYCPVCQGSFTEVKKLGYICPQDKTTPQRLFIDLFYRGQRIKLYSDKQGQVLDSYQRALSLLAHINYEIKHHTFDPSRYVKQELEKFYVCNLLDGFLTSKLSIIAPSYQHNYKRYVQIAREYFISRDVRELRKLDIIRYKEHLEKNFSFSEKHIKNILDNFRTFLRYLKNDLEIIDNVPNFPEISVPVTKISWLSPDVQRKVFECVPDENKPIMAFLMLTGCRPSEARALRCKDIDLSNNTITISSTFSSNVLREKRKGRNARSVTIPIHPELMGYLKERVENNMPNVFVFISNQGKHYSRSKLDRIWNIVKKKTTLPDNIRMYDATRHSFASQLVNRGVSLLSVSRLMGHSNTKMTERYAHSDIEKLKVDLSNLSLQEKVVAYEELKKVECQ